MPSPGSHIHLEYWSPTSEGVLDDVAMACTAEKQQQLAIRGKGGGGGGWRVRFRSLPVAYPSGVSGGVRKEVVCVAGGRGLFRGPRAFSNSRSGSEHFE